MSSVEHLVLSAGGHNGFRTYGALREAARAGVWGRADLKSIWGTSSGAIIGAMLAMGYDWEWLDDYLIKRPWHKVMSADERVLSMYAEAGVYGAEVVRETLAPLLEAKGHSPDIKMAQFSSATGVGFHCVATNVNGPDGFEKVVFGGLETPDVPLLIAIAASAAYPFLFKPIRHGDMCLTDGAVFSLYPLTEAIDAGCDPERTLGFKHDWGELCMPVAPGANLLDFSGALVTRFWQRTCSNDHRAPPPDGVREVRCSCSLMTCDAMRAAISEEAERASLVAAGAADARKAMESWGKETKAAPPCPPRQTTSETSPAS